VEKPEESGTAYLVSWAMSLHHEMWRTWKVFA